MMMSLSMSATATRSSLELMLDSFLRMDEPPSDLPPALPARPASRARLPPARKFRGGILTEAFEGVRKKKETLVESFSEEKTNEAVGFALMKIGNCNNTNERILEGILEIQKCFRGFQARNLYCDLRRGSLTLQTFVRGENARKDFYALARKLTAVIVIQRHVKGWIAMTMLQRKKKAALRLQRAIRVENDRKGGDALLRKLTAVIVIQRHVKGWITRTMLQRKKKAVLHLQRAIRGWLSRRRQKLQLTNSNPIEDNVKVSKSIIRNLQRRLLKAEREFARKEAENADLCIELRRFEERWLEYDERMKYLEASWQDQLSSLQRKIGEEENVNPQLVSCDSYKMYIQMMDESHVKKKKKEKALDGRLRADDELKKLKVRYDEWKKDYKVKLKETKMVLQKLGNSEKRTTTKKWWGL